MANLCWKHLAVQLAGNAKNWLWDSEYDPGPLFPFEFWQPCPAYVPPIPQTIPSANLGKANPNRVASNFEQTKTERHIHRLQIRPLKDFNNTHECSKTFNEVFYASSKYCHNNNTWLIHNIVISRVILVITNNFVICLIHNKSRFNWNLYHTSRSISGKFWAIKEYVKVHISYVMVTAYLL